MYPVESCRVYRPEDHAQTVEILASSASASYIPRGCGRSYGDAALNAGEGVLSQLGVSRIASFDAESGIVECDGGATIGQIVTTFLPRGYFPAVTPGTRNVTVGGAIACDVHGKNHLTAGSFGNLVESLTLLLPDGQSLRCSRAENSDVFFATLGGMGLTGVVTHATLRLGQVKSAMIAATIVKARGLSECLDMLERVAHECEHAILWFDPLGAPPGRGVLMGGDHRNSSSDQPLEIYPAKARRVWFTAPDWALSAAGIRTFNAIYYLRHREGQSVQHVERFLYPLDSLAEWNRLYGRRGFIQYQAAFPSVTARDAIDAALRLAVGSGHPPFLVTVKKFGKPGNGHLSFPIEGLTIALDMPVRAGLPDLVKRLDALVVDHRGRVYLGKDAFLSPSAFRAMYPRADEFLAIKKRLDPRGMISSSLSRRIGLT